MLKIISAPTPVLSDKAKPVSKIDKDILHLITEMKETLDNTHDPEGIGLAAPQVGKSLQIFIVKPTRKSSHQVFINPVIESWGGTSGRPARHASQGDAGGAPDSARFVEPKVHLERALAEGKQATGPQSDKKSTKLEGCLSLPDIWGEVIRSPKVLISYLDEHGKERKRAFTGFTATIIQHEYDHLQGELFPKRVLEQKGKLYKSKKDAKGEYEFEEIEI